MICQIIDEYFYREIHVFCQGLCLFNYEHNDLNLSNKGNFVWSLRS